MTLDDFLRTLETLIDERETTDDEPGEGNFGCEDCRKCNHCRFCVGCDSCEDCTYCEESIDCTSCTQSKRCVSCEKVSYCEDCRDCRSSRYLTLCVSCIDCVHCLGCVGLEGVEFYVLNEKRTRKEYFALLRQVQELMRERMDAGWRPPGIGLASEIDDPHAAGRNAELSAAPWLGPSEPEPPPRVSRELRRDDYERERPGRREPIREPERPRRDLYADEPSSRRAREPRREEYERPAARSPAARPREHGQERWERDRWETDAPRRAHEQPTQPFTPTTRSSGRLDAGRRSPERLAPAGSLAREREPEREEEDWDDRPITRELEWEDSRERTVARPRRPEREPVAFEELDDDDPLLDEAPDEREREPSSPWLDEEAQARRRAKRGSLRRAGRPKRKAEGEGEAPRESTSSASYRTGSAPARSNEGTHTGTGLRLGRKPKR